MENNGKSGILYLVLIPIIFVITLIIIDTLFSYIENKRFKTTTENIIKEVMNDNQIDDEDYFNEIKKRYNKYGYSTDMLVVEGNYKEIYLENDHNYFGLFSSIANKKRSESLVTILGLKFKIKKNSVARIKVSAMINNEGNIEFVYEK